MLVSNTTGVYLGRREVSRLYRVGEAKGVTWNITDEYHGVGKKENLTVAATRCTNKGVQGGF